MPDADLDLGGVRRELTARVDLELYEQVREATFRLRISKQQAMVEALEMWLRAQAAKSRKGGL